TFVNNGNLCIGQIYNYSITVNPTFYSTGILSDYNSYNVSFFGGSDGFIDLSTDGGSGAFIFSWIGPNGFTADTEDINNLVAGIYTVTISDGYCTPIILTFTLTQPPELLAQPDLSLTINIDCFGNSNGAVGVLITQESVAPYDYDLYDSSGNLVSSIINSFNLNPQFTGLIAGIYSLIVTDDNGGTKTVQGFEIIQPDDIEITATTTPITCYGANDASITIVVTGGVASYTAQWNTLATGLYQNNLAAGDYSIIITDTNGCFKSIIVNIPEAPIFSVNTISTNISCEGANDGSINVNLTGGVQPINLTWSDGSTAGLIRNNLSAGTYTVTIVDGTPCTIVRTFTIIEPQTLVLSANIQDALDCSNANSGAINLMVSGGTAPFSCVWSNGAITEDLTSLSAGNYSVTVTDFNGCFISNVYSIFRPQPISLSVQNTTTVNCDTNIIYENFQATGSGGVPPLTYSWTSGVTSGSNNQNMTTNQNGLVVITATDALGCSTNYSIDVDVPLFADFPFEQSSFGYENYGLYSINDPIQFTNNSTGEYESMIWNFGDGVYSNEENPSHTYVTPGTYLVTQTVTYSFGCVYVFTISLLVEKGYFMVVPTAFTPNNDSINDNFRPVTKGLKQIRMDIYDTSGSLIYSESGDVLSGWDGTIQSKLAENGNYNCMVSAVTFYGTVIYESQTFILIQ
ncbi:PKD domain-containing protein, partial [uncultured Flavobacterium sp.]|uniref:PKD domain-containing protein n=1 Tax=uncultured Flavobacterium sp. TaxID=165435 RepID=UPI0030CA35E0